MRTEKERYDGVPLRILHEDSGILIADKDRFMAVHGGLGQPAESTLLHRVRSYLTESSAGAAAIVAPVHRIDLNTRGPVVFGKTRDSIYQLKTLFASGGIEKTYEVLVEGWLAEQLFVEADLIKGTHRTATVRNMVIKEKSIPGRASWLSSKDPSSRTICATLLTPVEVREETTLCRAEIWTGRYHQIRAVCEAVGHPVCGDTRYNHNPRYHNRRYTNPLYPHGQELICRTLVIPALGLSVTSGFEFLLS